VILKEKAMADEHIRQIKEKVINELSRSGLTRSAMETVAEASQEMQELARSGLTRSTVETVAKALEEIQMMFAVKTSRMEYDMKLVDGKLILWLF
jgi:hypothetical protein